jgi:seryl-tRNA synthetase
VADAAVKALLARSDVPDATRRSVDEAWKLRQEILHLTDVEREHARTLAELSAQSEETRRSLRAIEKNKLADKLRAQLTKRLEDLAKKSEEVGKKQVEAQARLAEVNVRFRDLLRSVKYVAPVTTKRG